MSQTLRQKLTFAKMKQNLIMQDHAQEDRQRFIKSIEDKRKEAIQVLGDRWCLHPKSSLKYTPVERKA